MRVAAVDQRPVLEFLSFLENRIAAIHDESVICEMMQSLGLLKMTMETVKEGPEELSLVDSNTTSIIAEDDSLSHNETIVSDKGISEMCDDLLSLLSSQATEMIKDLRTQSLRTILMLFSVLPFQADECVEAMEREVAFRRSLLETAAHRNVDELLQQAASAASDAKRTLFGDDHSKGSKSPLAGLKNGLKSIFGSSSSAAAETTEDDSKNSLDEAAESGDETDGDRLAILKVKEALQLIIDTASAMENVRKSCQLSLDQSVVAPQQEALFELGRCSELVEQYRRIDFASGSRRSRFDQERRRDMTKRVLSRKLP